MLYDYSLRSNANARPDQRPLEFKSADGNWLRLDKSIAEEHYRVTNRGRVSSQRGSHCY